MDVCFECTACGKCCHGLKLPLSVDETVAWAGNGDPVQILLEAVPWPSEPGPEEPARQQQATRSHPARSGGLPVRIVTTLVASFEGACPHLQPDMRCGNYDERPRVCRIYPAEISPTVVLDPQAKACPEEAWGEDRPLLQDDAGIADPILGQLIGDHRSAMQVDVPAKRALSRKLGLTFAALSNEGYVVYSPDPAELVAILRDVKDPVDTRDGLADWTIRSNRGSTLALLCDAEAAAERVTNGSAFIGFFPDAA